MLENLETHCAWKCCSPSESDEDAPIRKWNDAAINCSCNCLDIHMKWSMINLLTLNVDFCWGGVCAVKVGGKARVSACIFFKRLGYDQRVSLTVGDDLNIRTVFQLFTLTKPPGKHNQNVIQTGTHIKHRQ